MEDDDVRLVHVTCRAIQGGSTEAVDGSHVAGGRRTRASPSSVGQATAVHHGVACDLVVDSSTASPKECACLIAARTT
ncbi:phosphotransferase-like protein [Nocardioides hwasunensis]|uniref:Uncharacterized protein n=1 Tax=Nocardioides hwasunensis TaxID=397258 RepID=A0ABR8MLR8_9ACTN|nr:hypothetical protein [Nocardioides hwasunensis]